MGGNGPLIEYATLREYLDTNVKNVLWIYYENDLENLEKEKTNDILINYLKDLNFTQNLKLKQNEIDSFISNKIKAIGKEEPFTFELKKFIKIYNTRLLILGALAPAPAPAPAPEFELILQLTKELVNKNNSKLYFVYLPHYGRYTSTYNIPNYNLVKEIVNELKIPFIDIHKEVFVKEQNPLKLFPFELGGHYNIDGYKKVAETIYKFTKD